jgi:hypothetical protein
MKKIFNWFKSVYEFYRYDGICAVIITFLASMLIVVPIVAGFGVYYGNDNHIKYLNDREIALEGCIDCKFTDYDNYYFYTCEGKEFWINRSTWINLNISECK